MPFDFARRHASAELAARVVHAREEGRRDDDEVSLFFAREAGTVPHHESFATIGCDAAASSDVGDAASASEYVAAVVPAAAKASRNGARASALRSIGRGVEPCTHTCEALRALGS